MKAIGYFIVDKDSSGDGVQSLDQGTSEPKDNFLLKQWAFSDYCHRNGHQPVTTFVDYRDDLQAEDHRPNYMEMLGYLSRSDSEFLVIVEATHVFGTTLESAVRRVLELDSMGAKVLCNDEEMPDPLQQGLKYWGGSRSGTARGDSIREGMKAKAIRGEGLGKPPIGYRVGSAGKLEVVDDEAKVVNLIYDLYTKDKIGMRLIVRHLNECGFPTRRGGGWSIVTVRDVLRNRAYLGTYNRFGMRVPGNHQPIIESGKFNLAQDIMAAGRPSRVRHSKEPFLLSGLIYCGECGNRMVGVNRRQGWTRKDGARLMGDYRYYQCQSRTNQSRCSYHTWRSTVLEEMVVAQITDKLNSKTLHTNIQDHDILALPSIWKTQERLKNQFLKNLEDTALGIISLPRLRSILDDVDAERNNLRDLMAPTRGFFEALRNRDNTTLLSIWESANNSTMKHILGALVSHINVSDGSIDVKLLD